jgi:CheY-like chemotaxis protein
MYPPRILIVDDEAEIRQVYRTILGPRETLSAIDQMAETLFSEPVPKRPSADADLELLFGDDAELIVEEELQTGVYEIIEASQAQEAIAIVRDAVAGDNPISLIFLDIRMPPGIDGVQAAKEIRHLDPNIEIVIMTAYSDYSYEEIVETVGNPERLLYFRKPFKSDQIRRLASSLTQQWYLERRRQQQDDAI